ncbi:MAG: DUF1573 domain-containing protein, partial [Candidatus Delongbacteria bacterium]|nr:DUF1573 domain-containing protein [Candidatus Delongbacteria bacterium]
EIVTSISNGVNFYNYTAHGCDTGFQDPELYGANDIGKTNDVANFGNVGKYPLIVGNCCLTNSFTNNSDYASTYGGDDYCFGENLLKQADGGAIGYIGASMSTYWDEDLAMGVGVAAIDEHPPPLDTSNPGMYDGVMALGYSSQAATKHVGLMAVEQLNTGFTDDYWSSYHLMGDPSVMIYFGIPSTMSAAHDGVIAPGATTYTVNTTPFAYVAMGDQAGVLHGAAQANSSGVAAISISAYTVGDTGKLVITAQFKQPYFEDVLCTGDTGGTYSVNQSNMNYGNVTVGGSSTIQFTISNSHNSEYLMGDITTITGYTVALAAKNTLSYSVAPNDSKTFDLVFAPTAQTSYNGNITITSTDTNHSTEYIAVTGAGALPDINVVANISATAAPEATTQGTLDVENTGLANLTYNATYNYVSWPGMKADVIVESNDFESGLVYGNVGNWTVVSGEASVTIQSLSTLTSTVFDASVATDLFLDFDHANLVRTAGYFQVEWSNGSIWTQVYNGTSTANGSEHIAIPNTAVQLRFIANVTRSQGLTGWQTLDNIVLSGPVLIVYDWLRLDGGVTTNDVVSPSGSDAIVVDYDATGCPLGIYTADITITSDDPDEPSEVVAVEFTVGGGTVVPGIPSNIVTSISGSDLVIDWDVAADATGYDVYSSDDPYGTFTLATSVGTNQYTVPADQAKLFYYIVATNATK